MKRVDLSRWAETRAVFDELVELPETERTERLSRLAADDPELFSAVDLLLRSDAAGDERLQQLESDVAGLMRRSPASPSIDSGAAALDGRVIGHFQILERIAAGGMGAVYRAFDTRLQRVVALKFPHQEQTLDTAAKERFLREARSAGRLDHPNLCPVFETGETDTGDLYIAMPFYTGRTLSEVIASEAPLPVGSALELTRQVAAGLACAHAGGVTHRDLKPRNVMILPDGTPKILDFGLAKMADLGRTASAATAGTPAYMAPEQVRGDAVDARADLWSLGVVLYEMLTAARPFQGNNEWSVIQKIVEQDPQPPSSLQAEISPVVDAVVTKLLEKNVARRYATADEVVSDITAIQRGDALSSLNASRQIRGNWLRDKRKLVVGLTAIVLLAVAAFAARRVATGLPDRPADATVAETAPAPSGVLSPRTVVVLPFTNLSSDRADQYFSDGLTVELAGALSQIRALRVVARSSAFAFRDPNRDVRAIGRRLGAGTVIEGSVRRYGDRVRVAAAVINTNDGIEVWSETYERQDTDVLAIQNELAQSIAAALETRLTPGERARLSRSPTTSVEAYNSYLKGHYFSRQRSMEALNRAIQYFDRAIAADSQFAAAYAGLANVYPPYVGHGFLPPWEGREQMRKAALKAVALDPELADAQVAFAAYMSFFEWDFAAGEKAFRRAIQLDPNDARAHGWYAYMLASARRHTEAIREGDRQAELSVVGLQVAGAQNRILAGETEGVIERIRNGLELDSTNWLLHMQLGWAHEVRKEWRQAVGAYEQATRLGRVTSIPKAHLARALVFAGREREARDLLSTLRAEARKTGVYPPQVATVLAALGEVEAAVDWLETAFRQRPPALPHALVEPGFERIRRHPRVVALLQENGLPL